MMEVKINNIMQLLQNLHERKVDDIFVSILKIDQNKNFFLCCGIFMHITFSLLYVGAFLS